MADSASSPSMPRPHPVTSSASKAASHHVDITRSSKGATVVSPVTVKSEPTFIGRGQRMRRVMTSVGFGREPTFYFHVEMGKRSKTWIDERKFVRNSPSPSVSNDFSIIFWCAFYCVNTEKLILSIRMPKCPK